MSFILKICSKCLFIVKNIFIENGRNQNRSIHQLPRDFEKHSDVLSRHNLMQALGATVKEEKDDKLFR